MRPDRALVVQSPEHVPIVLVPAGLGRRGAAFLIDLLLSGAVIAVLGGIARFLPGGVGTLVATTTGFLVMWGYHLWFEQRSAGQTPGKRIARLRVVDARGLPLSFQQSLVRNVARALDIIPAGGIGLLAATLDPHRRRLGDLAADTVVVEELQPPAPDLRSLAPPRVNSLDIPRIRRQARNLISLEERELLLALCLRADGLDRQARYDLFEAAGARCRRRLGIDDERLSGENVVRNLVSLLFQRPG